MNKVNDLYMLCIMNNIIYRLNQNQSCFCLLDLVFNDTGLTPFTEYSYQIEAENDFGSTRSPSVTYRTPSGSPSGEINLSLATVTARTATFTWQRPSSANGVIQRYVLLSTNHRDTLLQQHYQGNYVDSFRD